MTTLRNTTGTKAVNISIDGTGMVRAMFVQVYNGQESVLESKDFSSVKRAEKWGALKLN